MLIFTFAAGTIIYGSMEQKVIVKDGFIEINGIYGTKLNVSEIKDISLVDTLPEIKRKTNGFDFGNILKGNFELNEIGIVKLYINRGTPPYITIKYRNSYIILNFRDSSKTRNLYNDIKKQWNK